MSWAKISKNGGTGGTGGGGISPTLLDEETVKWDDASGLLVGTGDINQVDNINFGDKTLRCKDVTTEAGSINIGPSLTVSSRGGDQQLDSNVNGDVTVAISSKIDNTGSEPPIYGERGPLVIKDLIQPDDSTPTINVTLFTIASVADKDFSEIYFNFINPITSFRFIVVSQATGEIVRYFPSQHQFDILEGVSVPAGEVKLTPEAVFSEKSGILFDYLIFGDGSVDMLGDGFTPWYAADTQLITDTPIATGLSVALEATSTSLITGGVMTSNTTTTIDITAGSGRIAAFDGIGDPTPVSWPAMTNVAITNIGSQIATRFAFDITGTLVQLPTDLTPDVVRDYVNIGLISHATGVIGIIVNNGLKSQEVYSQLVDSFEVLGVTRKKGLDVSPNANLTFDKTAGQLQVAGGGNDAGTRGQNIVRVDAELPSTFGTLLGITDDLVASGQTSLDPAFYDSGSGTKTAIGAPASQATIVYIYQSIADPAGVFYMYGQFVYSSLSEAVLNAATERVQRPTTVEQDANLIARFAVRSDATDLTDPTQAELLAGVKFGSGVEGSLSGSISGGGDVLGPASSNVDEIPTYGDASGKVIKTGSDISAIGGTLTRIAAATDIDFIDGANGTVTFTTGGISGKNASATPKYRLTDNIDQTIGGIELNGALGTFTRLHRSLGEGVIKSELRMHDAYTTLLQKTAINTGVEPKGLLEIQSTAAFTENSDGDINVPLVINDTRDNGGDTPNAYTVIQQWRKAGVQSQAFGNIADWSMGRYEDVSLQSRTAIKLSLKFDNINNSATTDVMEWKSSGDVSSSGDMESMSFSLGGAATGGINWNPTGTGAVRIYRGDGVSSFQSELLLRDGYINLTDKTVIGSTVQPKGILQVNSQSNNTPSNTNDVDTPLVINDRRTNGGNTPSGYTVIQQWRKSGVTSQAFGNIADWAIGRYENVNLESRTAIKLSLAHVDVLNNDTVDVMEWKSNGEVSIAGKAIVGSASSPKGILQVNSQALETVNNTDDLDTPLVINDTRDNGGNTPNAYTVVQQIRKSGISNESFGNVVNWSMGRYENAGFSSRTALKIQMTHQTIDNNNVVDVMEWRSNGEVSMPTTTGALIPPKVTTFQMNAIPPDGLLINTDDNKLYIGNGVSWVLV